MPNSDDLGLVPPRCPTGSLGCMQYCSPKSLWIDTHGMLVPTQVFPIFIPHLFYFYLNSDAHRKYILPLFSSSVYCANLSSSHRLSTNPCGYNVSSPRHVLDASSTRPQRVLHTSSTRPRRVLDNPTECVCTSVFSTALGPDATATISPLYRNHHLLMHTNSALHTPTSLYLPVWGIPVLRRRHFHCMIMIHKPTLPR
jgi:hypothetical protein